MQAVETVTTEASVPSAGLTPAGITLHPTTLQRTTLQPRWLRTSVMLTALAAVGAIAGVIIATLLSHDPREALAYVVACLMLGAAVAIGRRSRTVADPATEARREMRAVAHDLRAPLVTVSTYLDLIAEGQFGALTPESEAAIRRASTVARRAQALVETTLQRPVDPPQAPALPAPVAARPEMVQVDLEVVLQEVLDALTGSMRQRSATISVEGRLPVVMGDRIALFRVLENLLQNSMKHCTDTPRVRLYAHRLVPPGTDRASAARFVEVIVADNGPGIPTAELKRVLRDGVCGSRSLAAGTAGAGLGLATVSRLVTEMGGTFTIDPPLEATPGAVMRLRLQST